MIKKCKGCGIELQDNDSKALGYVVDLKMDYCQRCFRMTHYDAHLVKDFIPDNERIIDDLSKLEGQFIWVMDIFDLETSLRSSLKDFYREHECVIILNKCDLLPHNINLSKLADYVRQRIREINVRSRAIVTRGINPDFIESLERFLDLSQPIIMTGVANVGKSTIINQLSGSQIVTTNPYPATTMRINEIVSPRYHIYDSAGLWINESMQAYLEVNDLKKVVPMRTIRPTVYQLQSGQSLSIGGLARLDLQFESCTAVTYLSNQLNVHRGKSENAENFWKGHFGQDDLLPIPLQCEYPQNYKRIRFNHSGKADYFICGLGFVSVTGENGVIDVLVPSAVQVIKRKAMI